jgi:hypothetical protein
VRACHDPALMAVKGVARGAALIGTPTAVDVSQGGKKLRRGIKVFSVAVGIAKLELYNNLRKTPEVAEDGARPPIYPPATSTCPRSTRVHCSSSAPSSWSPGATATASRSASGRRCASATRRWTATCTPAPLPPRPVWTASKNATGANWNDNSVDALKAEILGGADAAYDTLLEIQQLLQNGTSGLDAILSAVNNRVRFDAAQTLTVAEQLQARINIGAVAASDVGNTDTDFVADLQWGAGLMSLASSIAALAARIGFEVKTKIDVTHPGIARVWVSFGYVGGQVVIHGAQRR